MKVYRITRLPCLAQSPMILFALCTFLFAFSSRVQAAGVSLVVPPEDPVANSKPAQWATGELQKAIKAAGVDAQLRRQLAPMTKTGNQCRAVIPAEYTKTRFPISYYFVVDKGTAGRVIWPGLGEDLATMPYFVVRQERLGKELQQ